MKQINQYIKESILDDEDNVIQNNDIIIEKWLKDNYRIKGTFTIKNGIIDVKGNIIVTEYNDIQELLPKGYTFGKITGNFDCSGCVKLKSLNGGPTEVTGSFDCSGCKKLTSLEGAPKIIGASLNCSYCENLTTLEGCPEKIPSNLYCSGCKKLKSLDHIAKFIGGTFNCSDSGLGLPAYYIRRKTKIMGTIFD